MPRRARTNRDFIYFRIASASTVVSTEPIPIKDCVYPTSGLTTIGELKDSPNVPLPFTFGKSTLYEEKFEASIM